MPLSLRLAIVLGTIASVASAQTPCHAGVRELSDPTARAQLAELAPHTSSSHDVMADGAGCTKDSLTVGDLRFPLRLIAPVVRLDYSNGVPDSRNDGEMWEGLGVNALVRVGFVFDQGIVHATVAPDVWYAQNRTFNFFRDTSGSRSPFSSNWYLPPYSIDLPTRFGASSVIGASLGQSSLWATVHDADIGISNSSQAWGPGVRGQLLLSADAPGIPRVFVRTNHPIDTRAGAWSGTAFVGTLTESPFFDNNPANDLRTLSAWTLNWSPTDSSSTVIGVAHASMRTGSIFGGAGHKLTGPSDQMNSVYARVKAPDDGLRAWVEIARAGGLPGMHQFLTVPYQGIAYLVGAERAAKFRGGTLLLTGEAADLEQPTDIRGQPTQDFYTSNDIPQGWTQRGQLLGDGIGPGANSQWVSLDWVTPTRSTGVFVERVRWNEDAFLRQYLPFLNRHDVTMRVGIRGGTVYRGQQITVELSGGRRLNYLFQNGTYIPGLNTEDVTVTEL
ncbi:MAG TPA: hypothetical protein VIJ16_08470, partial [Gemmatimonadaceae bacterium]